MKVLIVKTSSLGDIVQTFHILSYLKNISNDIQIDWVVEHPFSELLQAHPAIHKVFIIHTKKWRQCFWKKEIRQEIQQFYQSLSSHCYDIIFDLQGNIKSGIVTALARSPIKVGFGRAAVAEWPNLLFTNHRYTPPSNQNIRNDYLFLVQSQFKSTPPYIYEGVQLKISQTEEEKIKHILTNIQPNQTKIMVCPGSNWTNKQLSTMALKEFLIALSQNMATYYLFIWGTKEEKQIVEELAQSFPNSNIILDKLALPTLQNLMAQLQLVIAMDSLPLHLAATTYTPTYSVFGASAASKYKPVESRHAAFQGLCPYGQSFEKRCAILRSCPTGACIKDISGHVLFNHFIKWWKTLPV